MGTAIFTGVTGLLAFQRRLDVVASNIANVNTTGYRASRVLFQDLFSQTLQGARAPSGNFGGSNPMQVGLGVRVGQIDVDHSQGSLQTTGVASDLAIQGAGFFVLNTGTGNLYTRDGSFSLNSLGQLIDPATGFRVQGFLADDLGNISTDTSLPSDLVVPVGGTSVVRATTLAILIGNLNSNATAGTTVTRLVRVFDSLGTSREVLVTFTKRPQVVGADIDGDTVGDGDFNAWEWRADFGTTDVTNIPAGETGVLLFDNNGRLAGVGSVDGADAFTPLAGDAVSVPLAAFTGESIPETPFEFDIDFSAISELSGGSDVTLSSQNGFPRGVLESFNIGADGAINGVFSNGLTVIIGAVALANFANIGGLERAGNNLFRETLGSGPAQIGLASTGGRGQVNGGVLEGSNVDLGTEFSNMIITQRGFQANARTITAADTLLQETVNLIR